MPFIGVNPPGSFISAPSCDKSACSMQIIVL